MSDVPAGLSDLVSNHFGFRPKAEKCCERCVFGSGFHAAFCPVVHTFNLDMLKRLPVLKLPKIPETEWEWTP